MSHTHTPPPATMATFSAWLEARQQSALQGMQGSTGEAFGRHCEAFTALTITHRLVQQFDVAQAGQAARCACAGGRA